MLYQPFSLIFLLWTCGEYTNWENCRYLVPADLTVGQFVYVIRKRIKLSAEKAIFIFVDNVLPPTGKPYNLYDHQLDTCYIQAFWFDTAHLMLFCLVFVGAIMSAIYEEKKDEDGFLYVTYSGENTFGHQISL